MRYATLGALLLGAGLFLAKAPAADTKDKAEKREALKALQDFIGGWKGSGGVKKPGARLWSGTIDWSWRFKGDDIWLGLKIEKGEQLVGGELRYLPAKSVYQFTALDAKGKKSTFEGTYKNNYLTLLRVDDDNGETQKLVMNLAGDGVRFIYRYDFKPKGKTLFRTSYAMAATKVGESLGATEKKNECVVSGGVGTMTVSYKGETFYVCCSGCRDEFLANPEKYIKEFKAKKGKK